MILKSVGFYNEVIPLFGTIMMVVNLLVIAPISEEIALRGIVYSRVEKTTNAVTAIIVSSILFGLMHLMAGGIVLVVGAVLMALVFGYIFYKFKSLWVCIIAHAVANLPDFILYNKPDISGGIFWGLVIFLYVCLLWGYVLFRKQLKEIMYSHAQISVSWCVYLRDEFEFEGENMMEWINIFGAVFIAVIMVPNIIFTLKYKDGFENKWNNKGVEVVEQIGRFGCFGFMVVNIPGTWFGWWSDEAFAIYLIANVVLIILYCVIWIICFRNNTIFKALTLSIIPSVIFIFSGIMSRSVLLIVASLLFAPAHILISYKNAKY